MKRILYIFLATLFVTCISGCGKEENQINSDSKLFAAKMFMIENLDNYSYDVEIIAKTGFMDVTTNMNCKDDRKNQISYCSTSVYGVETEEYVDYKNKKIYSKVTSLFGDSSNGKWTSTKYKGGDTNTWINLNNYIFDIKQETREDGTYYTGTINSKKLATAISQVDSNVDISNMVSDDIDISVFINSSNYIEKMSFTIQIMGIEELVEISFRGFNTSGDIVIPSEVKEN